jgi:hypothetical protein
MNPGTVKMIEAEAADRLAAHLAERAKSAARIAELEAALELCMTGGNHLVGLIDNFLLKGTPHGQALEHYGAGRQYDAWCCWDAIMRARDIRDGNGASE